MSEVISSFKSLRAGSQALALLMLFLCVILHNMWLGKSLQLLCIFPFGMLCLSAIRIFELEDFIMINRQTLYKIFKGQARNKSQRCI